LNPTLTLARNDAFTSATVRRLRPGLGTLIAISAHASAEAPALRAIEAAFAACHRVGRLLHPWTATSDLYRLNQAAPGTSVRVSADTIRLLRLATKLHTITAGAFDPCRPETPGRLYDLQLAGNCVRCSQAVTIDFGGFAKGLAVDHAVCQLRSHGCTAGVVNAGGDLRVFGATDEPVLVRGPDGQLVEVPLADTALAVSDADNPRRPQEHAGYYNRSVTCPSGSPTVGARLSHRFAAVVATEAVLADALTKVVMLCEDDVADRVLMHFGASRIEWRAAQATRSVAGAATRDRDL
jgi:FAD:protein FMN transferase